MMKTFHPPERTQRVQASLSVRYERFIDQTSHNGNFEVSEFLGLDEKLKTVYFNFNRKPLRWRNISSISLDGKRKQEAGNYQQ